MEIRMDTLYPSFTSVVLTPDEVRNIALHLDADDISVELRYMAGDYEVPCAAFVEPSKPGEFHRGRVRRI